ncbi:MAG: type II secretion system secretin GspD [Nitrospirae bacterium]|nr:type II secretion system secretin GspD [Nitrospirota bacterium]
MQQPPAKASDRMVTLDFNNVDLQTFIKFISELTGRNFVLDEKVQGKVTVISPAKISVDEAYQVFLTALDLKGFTAVTEDKVIKIFPSRDAKQSGVSVVTDAKPLPPDENYETRIVRLKYVSASEIARLIAPLISKDGSSIPYSQTNALILTDVKSNMAKLLNLIGELDMEPPKGKGGIYVYYLQNASAEDMAKVLANLTSRIPAKPPAGQPPQEAVVHFEGGISVTADKATNSLIIMASPEDYERLTSIIERLDVKRKQVFVEAAIVEMSLDKTRELGIEWRTTENPSATGYTIAGGTILAPTGIKDFSVNPLSVNGLVVAGVKGFLPDGKTLNVGALLRAFQADTDVNILSTPNILTLDNQEAKIIVGQNVPFITGTSQTAGGNVQATIERKDVGIQLKITPHTTESDLVRLDLYQEISSLGGSVPVGPDQEVPITNKRSAETSVVVRNNETVVIGGLIKDDLTVTERKVPILGDLPILGYLFRYQSKQKGKTNLILFLTPHIIRDSEALEKISNEKRKRAEEFREKYHFDLKDDFILNPPPDDQQPEGQQLQQDIQPFAAPE